MKPEHLIAHANRVTRASQRKPRQVDLKRAVSATYYALFHTLAKECADTIIGVGASRSDAAWKQTYRALEHGFARNACRQAHSRGFPDEITTFAETFAVMQEERHSADYDPYSRYTRQEVIEQLVTAQRAIDLFREAPRPDRRAFVALVLLREARR